MKMENNQVREKCSSFLPVMLVAFCLTGTGSAFGQDQIYDNFEGSKVIKYGERFGVLDSAVKNPAPNDINSSSTCALYVRNGSKKFANIKMGLERKLKDVDKYATYEGLPPRLKMKVYTTAPAGTLVEILLGSKRGNNDYPAGTHSQYQAYTSTNNEWEELEFKFSQIPQGSETGADEIDQIVLLFNPNSSTSDAYYFDDLTGPPLGSVPVIENQEGKAPAQDEKGKSKEKTKVLGKRSSGKKGK